MDLIIHGKSSFQPNIVEAERISRTVIEAASMTPKGDFAYRYTNIGPSFWQMLMESHFHVMLDYMNEVVWIALSSCKDFAEDTIIDLLEKEFRITEYIDETPLILFRGVNVATDERS